jgi:peptidoglycan lytic transglycosylase
MTDIGLSALVILCLLVGGCGSRQSQTDTRKVLETQTGLASFYGAEFHGNETASGEKFDMNELVAAHPSYPLGTVARVTNLDNGRSIEVRIIDRGPARGNRSGGVIIDLSKGAARQLDFVREGRERVRVEVLEWGKK